MPTGYEVGMYRDISRASNMLTEIAHSLQGIDTSLKQIAEAMKEEMEEDPTTNDGG